MKRHFVFLLFALSLLVLLSVACTRTVYIPAGRTLADLRHADSFLRDSIARNDTLRLYVRGDTVYSESIRTFYRDRYLRDTLCIHRIDSVPYAVEVVRTETVTSRWAWYALFFCFVVVIVSVGRLLLRIKK